MMCTLVTTTGIKYRKQYATTPITMNFGGANHSLHIAQALSKPTSLTVPPVDILRAGLVYAGFDHARQEKNKEARRIKWFKAFYGVAPLTVAAMFEDISDVKKDANVKEFLMALNWLFLYDTYPVLSGRWKFSEEFIMKSVAEYGYLIEDLSRKKIVFDLKDDLTLGRSVDCCNFMVQEMRLDPNSKWYDKKSNSCGLVSCIAFTKDCSTVLDISYSIFILLHGKKYEFCLALREARCVWISGPHVPSTHDITVFRGGDSDDSDGWDKSALYFQLGKGEKCVGDSGYVGEPGKLVVEKDDHPLHVKKFLSRAKNHQETFHSRLKSFNILGHRFRHKGGVEQKMRKHEMAVRAVACIVQYDYENGHPPFDI